jgi:hypothetical protein
MTANSTLSGTVGSYTYLQFNGVTSASYSRHTLFGNGSSVSSAASTSQTSIVFQSLPGTSSANQFAAGVIDILDPFETKNTTARAFVGISSEVALASGAFLNTAALSSITLAPVSGSFNTYSRFSLFGLRSA